MRACKDCPITECINRTALGGRGGFGQVAEPIMITSNHETKVDFMTDWEQVRIQAAIAAMQGYIGGNSALGIDDSEIAEWAVKQADALIQELKKEK